MDEIRGQTNQKPTKQTSEKTLRKTRPPKSTKTKKEKFLEKLKITEDARKLRYNKLKPIIIIVSVIIIVIIIICVIAYRTMKNSLVKGGVKINSFLSRHCKDPAVLDNKNFPWTKQFRDKYKDILKEFNDYRRKHDIPLYKDIHKESAANTDGWKALFLRVFGNDTDLMKAFPKTKALLEKCPCVTAYFSLLEPGTHIKPHVGMYKGVFRYHLSLIAPRKWENCFIIVDGKKLHWKEPGNDLLFDDMYLHEVYNNTNEPRVVLFLDIRRNFGNAWLNILNRIFLKFIACNDALVETVDKANRISNPEKYKEKERKEQEARDDEDNPEEGPKEKKPKEKPNAKETSDGKDGKKNKNSKSTKK